MTVIENSFFCCLAREDEEGYITRILLLKSLLTRRLFFGSSKPNEWIPLTPPFMLKQEKLKIFQRVNQKKTPLRQRISFLFNIIVGMPL